MKRIIIAAILLGSAVSSRAQNPTVDVTIPVTFTQQSQPGTPQIVTNAVLVDMVNLRIQAVDDVLKKHPIGVIRDADGKQIWPRP